MAKNANGKKEDQKSSEKLKKEQTEFSKLDKGTEKKPPFKELLPPEEKDEPSMKSSEESCPPGSIDLEEICGNLWVVLYQLGGILKKGFEPLTDPVKKLLAPPTARCAIKYDVQTYMKDEFLLLGILGVDISRRLMKKDDDHDRGKKEKGENDPSKKPDSR